MSHEPLPQILPLHVSARIQLVEDIRDRVAAEPAGIPLSDEQVAELDRRIEDAEANPGMGLPWAETGARLLGSRR